MRFSILRSVAIALLSLTICQVCSRADVTIYRDGFGTPSIAADKLADAMYGLGYAMAHDNAVAVARNYKQARGRLAEVDGKNQLLTDGFIQSLGMQSAAEAEAKALSGEKAELIQKFCDGENRAIEELKQTLPGWIAPVTPVDVLALAQLANAAFPLEDLAGQLFPGIGSNQFAVAAGRSGSGHALLSADPHLMWSGPLLWYEYSLYSRDVKFHGVTLNGLPFGAIGHTDKIAWTMTNNDPRLWGLFTVVTSSGHPGQYNYHGEWRDFEKLNIDLKYLDNGQLKTERQTVRRTAWGPMVPFRQQAAHLSVVGKWDQLDQSLKMVRARDAKQFRQALQMRGLSMWNIVYADTHGSIGYQYNARLPKRDPEFNWSKAVPGDDPRTKWGELWNLDDLPHVENPASQLLINANSTPWLTPLGPEIKPNAWPEYVTSYGPTTRSERLTEELSTDHKISVPNAMRYATDTLVPYAKSAIGALPRKPMPSPGPEYAAALTVLRAWNARADIDARGCTLYVYWLLADKGMNALVHKAAALTEWTAADQELAMQSLVKAARKVDQTYGKLDVPWGEVHISQRGDRSVPVSGLGYFLPRDSTATVTPNFGVMSEGKIRCVGGSSFRMIVDLDPKGVHSWSILPYGDIQDLASPHYADQIEMFGRGEYKDTLFGLNRIRAAAAFRVTLKVPLH